MQGLGEPGPDGKKRLALRLGFRQMDGFRAEWAERLAAARRQGDFASVESLARRAGLPQRALRLLADADAFRSIGLERRGALWEVRRTPDEDLPLFAAARASELGAEADMALPLMPDAEHVAVDYQTTRLSLKGHPMAFLRERLRREGALSCAETSAARNGAKVRVAGVVLVRQRPGKGNAIFVTLEDETGITNVLIWARLFETMRRPVMASRLMEVEGEVQRSREGVVHLMAKRVFDRTALLDCLSAEEISEGTGPEEAGSREREAGPGKGRPGEARPGEAGPEKTSPDRKLEEKGPHSPNQNARNLDETDRAAPESGARLIAPRLPAPDLRPASHPRDMRILPKSRDFH